VSIRVVVVSPECSESGGGGIGTYVHNMAKFVGQHQVEFILFGGFDATPEDLKPFAEFVKLPIRAAWPHEIVLWSALAVRRLPSLLRKTSADLVNFQMPVSHLAPALCAINLPIVMTLHNSLLTQPYRRRPPWALLYSTFRDVTAAKRSTLAVVLTRGLRDKLVKHGVPASHIEVIPNGVNFGDIPEPDPPHREASQLERPHRFLYVGRLAEDKGLETLVAATRQLMVLGETKFQVEIVGGGLIEGRLRAMAEGLPIVFRGRITSRRSLMQAYAHSDAFVYPSLGEGMPTAILEAMASGLPIIATAIPGIVDIAQGRFTDLVPPGDPNALARAMQRSIRNPATFEDRMEIRRQSERFSWTNIAALIADAFKKACLGVSDAHSRGVA